MKSIENTLLWASSMALNYNRKAHGFNQSSILQSLEWVRRHQLKAWQWWVRFYCYASHPLPLLLLPIIPSMDNTQRLSQRSWCSHLKQPFVVCTCTIVQLLPKLMEPKASFVELSVLIPPYILINYSIFFLVRPVLTYCSPIWIPHFLEDIIKLENIQRSATKHILNDFTIDYKSRLISLNLLPLMMTYEINDMTFSSKAYSHLLTLSISLILSYSALPPLDHLLD